MQDDASGGLDVTLLVAVAALAPARLEYYGFTFIAGFVSSHSIVLENGPLIAFFMVPPPVWCTLARTIL